MAVRNITMRQPILVIEPEQALRTSITFLLRQEGYTVLALGDESDTINVVRDNPFSLILFDPANLYDEGLALCRTLRASSQTASLPIILFLTRESDITQVERLGLHITDYLLKPLRCEELRACVHALIRTGKRRQRLVRVIRPESAVLPGEPLTYLLDDLRIDVAQRTVSRGNRLIKLRSALLFDLLVYFVRHRGIALTRDQLLKHVWKYEQERLLENHAQTVSVHVHWLREALEDDPDHPDFIKTVRGTGYRFKSEEVRSKSAQKKRQASTGTFWSSEWKGDDRKVLARCLPENVPIRSVKDVLFVAAGASMTKQRRCQ